MKKPYNHKQGTFEGRHKYIRRKIKECSEDFRGDLTDSELIKRLQTSPHVYFRCKQSLVKSDYTSDLQPESC